MSAPKSTLQILQEAFPPPRTMLSPAEVAEALFGKDKASKKRIEKVRMDLDNGTLIPGLRKRGARWQIPIVALAKAIDAKVSYQTTDILMATGVRRSKHSTIGPRMLLQIERSKTVWASILKELELLWSRERAATLDAGLPPAALMTTPKERPRF
ncbi:hypothetical protein LL972_20830 [Xanthomonas campestris pv. asclepiadis]|uniref:hypothetical protein n=1 Tax=Xanthomonas campestris TaxID=339 RepID=UPI001E3D6D3B|nr:hypothetical protein [Xanthomonas campestris]MCC4618405.1 hypothetical protein [Xanthomonas campestris pv. asclepiadis]